MWGFLPCGGWKVAALTDKAGRIGSFPAVHQEKETTARTLCALALIGVTSMIGIAREGKRGQYRKKVLTGAAAA